MKEKYIFKDDFYYNTLKQQLGAGVSIPVFHGVSQRGRGLGAVFGTIAKYAIPIISRYILPHAKSAAINTISDVVSNRKSLKNSLKSNSIGFLKNVESDILSNTFSNQAGQGIKKQKSTSC